MKYINGKSNIQQPCRTLAARADEEWKIIKPLLPQILPQKKQTRALQINKKITLKWHLLSTQEWRSFGRTYPLTLLSISITSSGAL